MDKHKILIIGTGMMGTSLANALIAKDFHEVFTFESMGNQSHAKRYVDGTWHQVYVDGIFKTVDIIVFATPRHVVNEFVAGKAYLFKKDVVITDISSAKGTLTKDINDILMRGQKKAGKVFVSSHPMCGSEKKGAVFADYKIFEDRNCIMISDVDIEEAPYSTYMIKHMWEHLGMRVSFVKSDYIHDVITASVSHIPHIVAMAMAVRSNSAKEMSNIDNRYYGNSIKDMTRIAGANPDMWAGVFLDNKTSVMTEIELLISQLYFMKDTIDTGDIYRIKAFIEEANKAKQSIG